jgi:ADP-ribose pyrophosphatase
MLKTLPKDAILIPEKASLVFHGIIFDVYQWPQELFDGSFATFEMIKRPDSIEIIAIRDNKIIFIEDDQPHLGHKETVPEGRTESTDKSWLDTAQRELLEETGFECQQWRLVAVEQPLRKIEWFGAVFLAWDVKQQQSQHLDTGEHIQVSELSFTEAREKILNTPKLRYLQHIFEPIHTIEELMSLPEFVGTEVDR